MTPAINATKEHLTMAINTLLDHQSRWLRTWTYYGGREAAGRIQTAIISTIDKCANMIGSVVLNTRSGLFARTIPTANTMTRTRVGNGRVAGASIAIFARQLVHSSQRHSLSLGLGGVSFPRGATIRLARPYPISGGGWTCASSPQSRSSSAWLSSWLQALMASTWERSGRL